MRIVRCPLQHTSTKVYMIQRGRCILVGDLRIDLRWVQMNKTGLDIFVLRYHTPN